MFSPPPKTLETYIPPRKSIDITKILFAGLCKSKNMTSVKSDATKRWEQELHSPPGETSQLKERDKHCMFYTACVCVRWRKTVFETFSSALWELCLCYPDNGVLTHMKNTLFFFSSTVKHFYLSFANCQRFSPSFLLILHLYISAFLLLHPPPQHPPPDLSSLVFSSSFISSSTLWVVDILEAQSEETVDAREDRIAENKKRGGGGLEIGDANTRKVALRGILE